MQKTTEKDPIWKQNGTQFVESVTKLLERLLDYRSVMQVMKEYTGWTVILWNQHKVKYAHRNIISIYETKETVHSH